MNHTVTLISGIKLIQWNIGGFELHKPKLLEMLNAVGEVDVIALQETKISRKRNDLEKIQNYKLVDSVYHLNYGISMYVNNKIKNVTFVNSFSDDKLFLIKIQLHGVNVFNIYKSPKGNWSDYTVFLKEQHPTIYLGNFNSDHIDWKYSKSNAKGHTLMEWSEANNLSLIFDYFQLNTCSKNENNPNICWVTRDGQRNPLHIRRTVLPSKNTDHRPILYDTNFMIPLYHVYNWTECINAIEANINFIETKSFTSFIEILIKKTVKCEKSRQTKATLLKQFKISKSEQWKALIHRADLDINDLYNFYNNLFSKAVTNITESSVETKEVDEAISGLNFSNDNYVELCFKNSGLQFREWLAEYYDHILNGRVLLFKTNSSVSRVLLAVFQNFLYNKVSNKLKFNLPFYQLGHSEILLLFDTFVNRSFIEKKVVCAVVFTLVNCPINETFSNLVLQSFCANRIGTLFCHYCKKYDEKKLAALGLKLHLPEIKKMFCDYRVYVIDTELLIAISSDFKNFDELNDRVFNDCIQLDEYYAYHGINTIQTAPFYFNLGRKYSSETVLEFGGCKFDRQLNYTAHTAAKMTELHGIKNLIYLISETDWGNNSEYLLKLFQNFVLGEMLKCSSVWIKSSQAANIDLILYDIMRIICGTLKNSMSYFLPVILNIPSPEQSRQLKLKAHHLNILRITHYENIQNDIKGCKPDNRRLKRVPAIQFATTLKEKNETGFLRNNLKRLFDYNKKRFCFDMGIAIRGLSLDRPTWITLNRIRTNLCSAQLQKVKCRFCENKNNGLMHIVSECPITRYRGSLNDFLVAAPKAIAWINNLEMQL